MCSSGGCLTTVKCAAQMACHSAPLLLAAVFLFQSLFDGSLPQFLFSHLILCTVYSGAENYSNIGQPELEILSLIGLINAVSPSY